MAPIGCADRHIEPSPLSIFLTNFQPLRYYVAKLAQPRRTRIFTLS
jgi:hypothetical protein